jgi:precorrin-2/cobalt-factor-2 C20-methyltransferase
MKPGTLYGISLGPGDPGLITVKGLELLRQADRVYYAGSRATDGAESSYSRRMLDCHGLAADRLRGVFVPMSEDRTVAESAYREAFAGLLADCRAGRRVAFACEGDISFYSTFSRLLAFAHEATLPVEIVAGVPAFLLGAAVQAHPLATGPERIAVLPRLRAADELARCLETFDVAVLIKIRGVAAQVADLAERHGWSLLLCEHLGAPNQFVSTRPDDLRSRALPYLSLLIVRRTSP